MRRCIELFVALAVVTPARASAQSIWLGTTVGAERTTWTGNTGIPGFSYDGRTGGMAGIVLSLRFTNVFAVRTEALYSAKGATQGATFRAAPDYLELPIMLQARLPIPALPVWPHVYAGIAPSWEMSCSVLAVGAFIPEGPAPPPTLEDCRGWLTDRLDLGTVWGAGIDIPLRHAQLTAEVRRTSGQRNIAQGYAPLSLYNQAWQFLLSMEFPLTH